MASMIGRWALCTSPASDGREDERLSRCVSQSLRVECAAARPPASASHDLTAAIGAPASHGAELSAVAQRYIAARRGVTANSTGGLPPRGFGSLMCSGVNGSVVTRQAELQLYSRLDGELCASVYPLSANGAISPAHVRYARFLMNGAIETSLLNKTTALNWTSQVIRDTISHAGRCRLAVNIQTAPFHVELRYAVRQTWLRVAQALGDAVFVRFIVGTPKTPLEPAVQAAYTAELAHYGSDILRLDFTDCYHCLYFKLLAWFRHAHSETECEYIAKVDDDTYTRLIPLINYLDTQPRDDVYFGMAFHSWAQHPNLHNPVVNDTGNKWHMADLFPALAYWPPFVNGNIVGLSRNLIPHVLGIADRDLRNFRVDDAALGVFISEKVTDFKTGAPIVYANDQVVFGAQEGRCSDNSTAWDSPNFSFNYNLYDRYDEDLDGTFCRLIDRSGQPEEFQRDDGRAAMVVSKRGDRVALWSRPVPWVRDRSSTSAPRSAAATPAFVAIHGTQYGGIDVRPPDLRIYGGDAVSAPPDSAQADEVRFVSKRAPRYARRHCGRDHLHVGHWRSGGWESEHLWAEYCWRLNSVVLLSLRVTKHPHPDPLIIARVTDLKASRLVVLVPASCYAAKVVAFVRELAPFLQKVPGPSQIVIGWGVCRDGVDGTKRLPIPGVGSIGTGGTNASAAEVEALVRAVAGYTPVKMIAAGAGAATSEAAIAVAAAAVVHPDDLVVTLDASMRVTSDRFFLAARAVAARNQTVLFPVPFQRYPSATISRFLAATKASNSTAHAASQLSAILPSVGRYMSAAPIAVGIASDLQRLGAFNALAPVSGTDLVNAAHVSHLAVLRLTSLHVTSVWAPVDCGEHTLAADSPEAYERCAAEAELNAGSAEMLRVIQLHAAESAPAPVPPSDHKAVSTVVL